MQTNLPKKLREVTDRNFAALILVSARPVLVDFWAPWCTPCLAMAPVMDQLAADYADRLDVVKCNVDQSPMMSTRYGIQSIPTLVLFKEGQPARKIIGLCPADRIKSAVDQALGPGMSTADMAAVSSNR